MKSVRIRFILRLCFITGFVFAIHLFTLHYLENNLFDSLLVEAYIANISLALIIYFSLYHFRVRFKNQLGFLFLLGSMLKFLLFFLLFNSVYKEDGAISPQEFFAFFVPYTITLIVEVYSLSKWMNKLEG